MDDETRFLMEKIEFSSSQNMRLKDKVSTLKKEILEVNPEFKDLVEKDIIDKLDTAPHGKPKNVPDFLDSRTKTETVFRINKNKINKQKLQRKNKEKLNQYNYRSNCKNKSIF